MGIVSEFVDGGSWHLALSLEAKPIDIHWRYAFNHIRPRNVKAERAQQGHNQCKAP